MILLLTMLACGDKDPATPDSGEADTDTDTDADTDTDTDADTDPTLRDGFWNSTIVSVDANTCDFAGETGDVLGMFVETTDDGDTSIDGIVITYEGSDIVGSGEQTMGNKEVDCLTTVTTSASGEVADSETLTRWGRHDIMVSEGTECDGAPGGTDGCEVDMTFSAIWSSEDPPEPE